MTESDRNVDVKKVVGDILRKVDQLIKAGAIDESIREIIRAKEIDPKHGYIRAYEERLAHLKEEHEKNIELERTRREAEEAARRRDEELRGQKVEERKRLAEEQKRSEDERRRKEGELKRSVASQTERIIEPQGLPTGEDGRNPPAGAAQIEISSRNSRPVVLVVEDDEAMSELIEQVLAQAGYQPRPFKTSDEALILLKNWRPNLIVCDINLETSTMGGFSFYEKVRSLDHLHEVPFVFLTGLNDEVLQRTAKELGADDYLTKPISAENLLATVKGKLKRFGRILREET